VPTERDYYAILQIPHKASQDEVERAYQRLSAQYDPATSRKSKAAQRHAEVLEAYEALSDRERRRQYDRSLTRGTPGELLPSEALSNRFIIISAGIIIASIAAVLAAILLFAAGGGNDKSVTTSITPFATPAATDVPTPTGPTPTDAPAGPPEISGEPVTTSSGLQYIDIVEGTGAQPTQADQVQVWYTGWLQADGTKFDSSVDRGTPSVFAIGGVVQGFAEGLLGMKEGGQRRLIMPPELGYGSTGGGGAIPPNATLIFDVELLRVIPGATPSPAPATTAPVASVTPTP
jgi:peptidylprolyl isomerase